MKSLILHGLGFTLAFLISVFHQSARADLFDSWTTNVVGANVAGFRHVAYGNSIFVAVGQSGDAGEFYTSTNGLNWTAQYTNNNAWGLNMRYSGGRFMGVKNDIGFANTSPNGTNWTATFFPSGTTGFWPYDITYSNGLYVAVGYSNSTAIKACIQTSPDGVTWTPAGITIFPGNSLGGLLNSVAFGNGRFAAIGNNDGYVYTSTTGTSWTQRLITGGSNISFANGLFFVPLNNKTNLISTTGTSWSQYATGLTNALGKVFYANGSFWAQAGVAQNGSYLAASADGTNWFQYPKLLPNLTTFGDAPDYDCNIATDGNRMFVLRAFPGSIEFRRTNCVLDSGPMVQVRLTNNPTRSVVLSGLVGRTYQIQSRNASVGAGGWSTNITITLTNSPMIWADSAVTNNATFYRAVLLP